MATAYKVLGQSNPAATTLATTDVVSVYGGTANGEGMMTARDVTLRYAGLARTAWLLTFVMLAWWAGVL